MTPLARSLVPIAATSATFVALAIAFFLTIGQPPFETLWSLVVFSVGDPYSISESLAKTAPILLCALAAAVPGRLGLISVGAEGQLHIGAIAGTAVVLAAPGLPMPAMLPAIIVAAAIGGGAYGYLPGLLRARLSINETITTLVLNYVAVLLVSALVYGPWRDPASQGWPSTMSFPEAAVFPALEGTRIHLGLLIGIVAAIGLHVFFAYGRRATQVRILAGNRKVGETFGLSFRNWTIVLMAVGGALAGLAGIAEVSAIQGRLQPNISLGYGLTGFLVAWLGRHQPLAIVPLSLMVGCLVAASDALQLFAKIPAASAIVLQGLLFVSALAAPGLLHRFGRRA